MERQCLSGSIVSVVLFASLGFMTLGFFWEGGTGDTFGLDG